MSCLLSTAMVQSTSASLMLPMELLQISSYDQGWSQTSLNRRGKNNHSIMAHEVGRDPKDQLAQPS